MAIGPAVLAASFSRHSAGDGGIVVWFIFWSFGRILTSIAVVALGEHRIKPEYQNKPPSYSQRPFQSGESLIAYEATNPLGIWTRSQACSDWTTTVTSSQRPTSRTKQEAGNSRAAQWRGLDWLRVSFPVCDTDVSVRLYQSGRLLQNIWKPLTYIAHKLEIWRLLN